MTAAKKTPNRRASARNEKTSTRVVVQPAARTAKAAPAAAAAAPNDRDRYKVRATKLGFYDNERRRVNDVFIVDAGRFNPSWMDRVSSSAALQRTTGAQELKQQMKNIAAAKRAEQTGQPILTGRDDVPDDLDLGEDNPLGT